MANEMYSIEIKLIHRVPNVGERGQILVARASRNHKNVVVKAVPRGRVKLERSQWVKASEPLPPWDWPQTGYQNERACEHGIGHGRHIHGCDGCCGKPGSPFYKGDKPVARETAVGHDELSAHPEFVVSNTAIHSLGLYPGVKTRADRWVDGLPLVEAGGQLVLLTNWSPFAEAGPPEDSDRPAAVLLHDAGFEWSDGEWWHKTRELRTRANLALVTMENAHETLRGLSWTIDPDGGWHRPQGLGHMGGDPIGFTQFLEHAYPSGLSLAVRGQLQAAYGAACGFLDDAGDILAPHGYTLGADGWHHDPERAKSLAGAHAAKAQLEADGWRWDGLRWTAPVEVRLRLRTKKAKKQLGKVIRKINKARR